MLVAFCLLAIATASSSPPLGRSFRGITGSTIQTSVVRWFSSVSAYFSTYSGSQMETSRCSQCGGLSTSPLRGPAFDLSVAPGTRHHALFNSNEPPDDSELSFIRSVVSETDGPLACLDDEILKLRQKLQELEAEHASLLSYRTRNSAILSPLRRMPPEVLREIFSWTLPSPLGASRSGRFDMALSPWVLARISSRWAAIALSTPSLWSRIVIDYPNAKISSTYSLSLVEAQLRRSQKLKIHFYGSRKADSPPQIQMFQLLSQHSARWEELSIGLTPETWPLLNALRDRLPSLARLWIQWDCPEDQIGVQSIDCFQTASSLVDVGIFNEYRFVSTLLPVNQLTRYELDCPWEQHKTILKQSQNLLEARIEVGFDEGPWPDADETIGLLQLRRLYVSAPRVLQYLWAPALDGLAFAEVQNRSSDILSHVGSFLDRSSCRLRRLVVGGFPAVRTTTEILHKCSSITELIIVHEHDDAKDEVNALMTTLAASDLPGRKMIAPHLHTIFFGCAEKCHLDYGAYVEMLKSRWKAENCALKVGALLVDEGPKPDSATIDDLHALRREGLEFFLMEGVEAGDELGSWGYSVSWNK